MRLGEIIALAWLFGSKRKEKEPEAREKTEVSFGFEYSTRIGRRIGFIVFVLALLTAIVCLIMGKLFFAALAGYVALGGLIMPFLSTTKQE